MSFGINQIGKPAAVMASVNRDTYVPDPVKKCIEAILSYFPEAEVAFVEGSGHFDTSIKPPYGPRGTMTLSIRVQPEAKDQAISA
jgi:hypothetical protein